MELIELGPVFNKDLDLFSLTFPYDSSAEVGCWARDSDSSYGSDASTIKAANFAYLVAFGIF